MARIPRRRAATPRARWPRVPCGVCWETEVVMVVTEAQGEIGFQPVTSDRLEAYPTAARRGGLVGKRRLTLPHSTVFGPRPGPCAVPRSPRDSAGRGNEWLWSGCQQPRPA